MYVAHDQTSSYRDGKITSVCKLTYMLDPVKKPEYLLFIEEFVFAKTQSLRELKGINDAFTRSHADI